MPLSAASDSDGRAAAERSMDVAWDAAVHTRRPNRVKICLVLAWRPRLPTVRCTSISGPVWPAIGLFAYGPIADGPEPSGALCEPLPTQARPR